MSDLAVSPGALAPALLPRIPLPDAGLAQRNPDATTPATETTLSPASERIIGLMAEERDDEEIPRLDLAQAEQVAQIAAREDADRDALQAQRAELVDDRVSNAQAEEVRRTEEVADAESPSENLAAARSMQGLATRTGEAEAVARDRALADEITDMATVVRTTEDALVAPARLADLLERMQAARPAATADGTVTAGEALPLPVAVALATTDRPPGTTATQESGSNDAPEGSDAGATLPDLTLSGAPEDTAADDTEAGATEVGASKAEAEVAMPIPLSEEDQARSGPGPDELAEQARERILANQAGVEERRAEQDEVERAADGKTEERRAQESDGAERFFEELAAVRAAENLVTDAESADVLRTSAMDAATEARLRDDRIAQVAASVRTAEDEMTAPARLADLLEKMQAAHPGTPTDGAVPAGEVFPLPEAVAPPTPDPPAPAGSPPEAAGAVPRPDPGSVGPPEDAAARSAASEQAERPAVEPSTTEAMAGQDAALRRTQMFGTAAAGEGRAPSSRATQPDSRPETRDTVSATTPIQANSDHANADGQDDTPAGGSGPSTPGAAAAPRRDAAGLMVPNALSGQMLNLSV